MKLSIKYHHLILFLYFTLAYFLFSTVAEPAINDDIPVRIWADSKTYIDFATNNTDLNNLISIGGNYLGPFILLKIFNFNHLLVFLFNFSLLFLSLEMVIRHYKVNRVLFTLIFLLNPLTLASILLVNKEIFGIFSLALLATYLKNKSLSYLFATLLFAALTRWQELAVVLIFLSLVNEKIFPSKFRILISIAFILGVGTTFAFISDVFSFIGEFSAELLESQTSQGFGILQTLNELQNKYLYFLAFFPKLILNLVGNVAQVFNEKFYNERLFIGDYYSFFILSHQIWMFFMIIALIVWRKFNLSSKIEVFIYVYCIIYCLNLFIQYRYFYPISILFTLILLEYRNKTIFVKLVKAT